MAAPTMLLTSSLNNKSAIKICAISEIRGSFLSLQAQPLISRITPIKMKND